MATKLQTLNELRKNFGFSVATHEVLRYVGLPTHVRVKYPLNSLEIRLEDVPVSFWKNLEQSKWELNLMRFINELVTPQQTIMEVGAWMGPLTFLFSHLTGKRGAVYSFEPMPHSFSMLQSGLITNKISNVCLQNMAVSNFTGDLTLYAPSSNSDLATTLQPDTLVDPKAKQADYCLEVPCKCTTLDEFCEKRQIVLDGLKIDVEGAENRVFEGAAKTIDKYSPWCLLEFHGHLLSESDRQETWDFIRARAQEIVYINGDENQLHYKKKVPTSFIPSKRGNYCIFFGS
ncbi:MAG: FkbM family methyltransferase [Candidatus Bathyarchaeota archaeon]|nr:FkbM family methyltransferase [Candidatus Bathyarchaeota archaeon]